VSSLSFAQKFVGKNVNVTEAGSGVVSEQRNRLVATIKFIYAGIQKLYKRKKKGDCKLKRIN